MALIGKNLKDKLSTFTKKCNQKFFEELWQEILKLQNADNAMDNRALVLDSRLTALEKQTAELSESLDYRLYAVADRLSEKKPAPPPHQLFRHIVRTESTSKKRLNGLNPIIPKSLQFGRICLMLEHKAMMDFR